MSATQAIATRLQRATVKPGTVGLDPLTLLALVQALSQLVIACVPLVEDAVAWLRGERRFRLGAYWMFPAMRRAAVEAHIATNYHGPRSRLDELTDAILAECDRADVEEVHDLYMENRC